MPNLPHVLAPEASPRQVDLGLLVLRVAAGASLFIKHGLEKLTGWHTMMPHFLDPIGIGVAPSFLIAMSADGICSVLVVLGLFTRWASLWTAGSVFVAWAFVHHFVFFSQDGGDHGEVCLLYIVSFLALALTGGGRYSLDARISHRTA